MRPVRTTYVEFLYPGSFFSESSSREVGSRDVSRVEVPENAFGFRFFDIITVSVDTDDERLKLHSKRINVSPMHYYGGKVYTAAQIKREFPDERTLISNMKGNGWEKLIRCRTGNWQPFGKTDIFVNAS